MVRLGRQIRFSINPFLDGGSVGGNAYASKPGGEGLALFLELGIELLGPIDPDTGFVINVVEIDRIAEDVAVPIFAEAISGCWRRGKHIDLTRVARMLEAVRAGLSYNIDLGEVDKICVRLNPFRTVTMDTNETGTITFSEKFEFAAMHKLWNDAFSAERNFEVFGKCAHPTGHGHNYVVEVTVSTPAAGPALEIGRFERVVDAELIQIVDHKNLNVDVPAFERAIPTVENIATFAWECLAGKLAPARLRRITVWETDRTYCTYEGPER